MLRRLLSAALLVAVGAAAMTWIGRDPGPPLPPPPPAPSVAADPVGRGFPVAAARDARAAADLAPRVRELEERLARESAERQQLQVRLDQVTAQLAALGGLPSAAPVAAPPPAAVPPRADAAPATDGPSPDESKSEMERALIAAGLDAAAAGEIKRHGDALAMAEMYLRDQATRENWLDTSRFQEEMAAIEAQRYSIRDQLGDEAYDRYLYALGRTNRVRIDDVMSDSPAADAGLQTGDMILRYGDARVFAPDELVAQTRQGTAGELVRLEVVRQGEVLTVEVPRGPLGLRIAATQSTPHSG